MPKVAGIDVGSAFTKAVLVSDAVGPVAVVGRGSVRTGVDLEKAASEALADAVADAGIERQAVDYLATTGFGRYSVSFRDLQVTEITSGARGARYLFPSATAVLDIGSQCTRAVALAENGRVRGVKTREKCAGGSGRFIGRAAKYMELVL